MNKAFFALAFVAVCLIVPAQAQIVSGSIVGSLKDPSGAAIPGAEVTARHEATDLQRKTVSDSAGDYSFASLPLGKWSITATHAGFKAATISSVELLIAQTARVDMTP